MWVRAAQLENFRGFAKSGVLAFGRRANVLVGPNNAGKSSVIRAIYHLQERAVSQTHDVRVGHDVATILLDLEDLDTGYAFGHERELFLPTGPHAPRIRVTIRRGAGQSELSIRPPDDHGDERGFDAAPQVEPQNLIYPYLSRRKAAAFSEDVRLERVQAVGPNLTYLNAKIDRLAQPAHPSHEEYMKACEEILNLRIGTFASTSGKQSGLQVSDFDTIPLEFLGEGVSNVLGLIASLCVARHKIYLIEELENDIHPQALKALLRLIIGKSEENQFFVSTHSNIVMKYLGSIPDSTVHQITMHFEENLPISTARRVSDAPEERRAILEDLGYELFDFNLWEGWLILEEASTERIVREYLIPWFAQGLESRLRTLSAGGIGKMAAKFEDFDRLFLFVHLEHTYRDRAWVVVDGDEAGRDTIERLKTRYVPAWKEESFLVFDKSDFEEYYPATFADEATNVLAMEDRNAKREAKKDLLFRLIEWIETNPDTAKTEFEESAVEVIAILRSIEATLGAKPPVEPTPEAAEP